MDDLNVWGVNWIDGMLVSSKHFNQQQDFAVDLNRWCISALSPGYGLAQRAGDQGEPLEVQVRRDGDQISVSVKQCTAILPNGSLVNVNSNLTRHQAVETKFSLRAESRPQVPVYLYASPDEKVSFGDPAEGEELSRAPWQIRKLVLTLQPSESISASCGIQIAELVREADDYKLAEDFVPPVITTACGQAVRRRMARFEQQLDKILKTGQTALAEARLKTKGELSVSQEETVRGSFLQAENLMHQIAYSRNMIFDKISGVTTRMLIDFCTGLVRGFVQSFAIYPELREHVRTGTLTGDWGSVPGGSLLPELSEFQGRDYGFGEMTRFFDESERALSLVNAVLSFYASEAKPAGAESLELDGHYFELQQHGAVKYSLRNGRHHIIIDGVDPRSTKDVAVRFSKRLLPQNVANAVIIYLGPNDVDDIAAASVARKPREDLNQPDSWLIQPNEYFPLKVDRLDRLNVIIDGELDAALLESVRMEDLAIFSRSR